MVLGSYTGQPRVFNKCVLDPYITGFMFFEIALEHIVQSICAAISANTIVGVLP